MDYDEVIRNVYKDPLHFGSATKVARELRGKVPAAAVKDFFKRQEHDQLHKAVPHVFCPILPKVGRYGMDLAFVPWMGHARLVPVLCVISYATRQGYARALKNKEASTVTAALKEIIDEAGDVQELSADMGSEFISSACKSMLAREGIELYFIPVGEKTSAGIIERFIRTLKGMVNRYVHVVDSNWKPGLEQLIDNYNHSLHTGIGVAPDKASVQTVFADFIKKWIAGADYRRLLNSLTPGTRVRTALQRTAFGKEGQRWSKDIQKVIDTVGYRVRLSDGSLRLARDVQPVEEVTAAEPKQAPVPEAVRKKARKTTVALNELKDFTSAAPEKRGALTTRKIRAMNRADVVELSDEE
jgi:hypothetical protein